MSDYEILCFVKLGLQHRPTGKTRHYLGTAQVPPAAMLNIVKYPDDEGFYLLHIDEDGNEIADTYHDSLEAAKQQANWEYSVRVEEWKPKNH
jgi:hypothetical protein